jgi:hypothetical protein
MGARRLAAAVTPGQTSRAQRQTSDPASHGRMAPVILRRIWQVEPLPWPLMMFPWMPSRKASASESLGSGGVPVDHGRLRSVEDEGKWGTGLLGFAKATANGQLPTIRGTAPGRHGAEATLGHPPSDRRPDKPRRMCSLDPRRTGLLVVLQKRRSCCNRHSRQARPSRLWRFVQRRWGACSML